MGAHVDQGLEHRRTRLRHPQRRRLLHHRTRPRVAPDRARAARPRARLLQRLPSPREPDPQPRHGPRRVLPVRLPLLRVQPRRLQEVRPRRGHLHPGRTPGDGARGGALRYLGRLGLVQHEPRRRAPHGVPRPSRAAPRPLPLRGVLGRGRQDDRVGHELEGVGGRLQRGLPRAGHSPAAAGRAGRHPRADRPVRAAQPLTSCRWAS